MSFESWWSFQIDRGSSHATSGTESSFPGKVWTSHRQISYWSPQNNPLYCKLPPSCCAFSLALPSWSSKRGMIGWRIPFLDWGDFQPLCSLHHLDVVLGISVSYCCSMCCRCRCFDHWNRPWSLLLSRSRMHLSSSHFFYQSWYLLRRFGLNSNQQATYKSHCHHKSNCIMNGKWRSYLQ